MIAKLVLASGLLLAMGATAYALAPSAKNWLDQPSLPSSGDGRFASAKTAGFKKKPRQGSRG